MHGEAQGAESTLKAETPPGLRCEGLKHHCGLRAEAPLKAETAPKTKSPLKVEVPRADQCAHILNISNLNQQLKYCSERDSTVGFEALQWQRH